MAPKKITGDCIVKVNVRMYESTKARITEAADRHGRSVNAEILARIDASFGLGNYSQLVEAIIGALEAAVAVLRDRRGLACFQTHSKHGTNPACQV
jgi:hypothetical protein